MNLTFSLKMIKDCLHLHVQSTNQYNLKAYFYTLSSKKTTPMSNGPAERIIIIITDFNQNMKFIISLT